MNAEKYRRITSWALLICFGYMWLTALIEKRPAINPFREINVRLFMFLALAGLCIFIPLELVKIAQWLFAIADLYERPYRFILKGLYVVAIYLIIRLSFTLLGFIDGKVILPHENIRMSRRFMLPLFKCFVVYLLPLAALIFLYMYSLNYVVMKLELTEQGPIEAIFFTVLYAPVFLLIHPFMVSFGATNLYVSYTQATAAETSGN